MAPSIPCFKGLGIELEFAKKVIIQSQITITFYEWFEILLNRRYFWHA